MKQVININFQGRVVPIEVSAYEILKDYIESLRRHFADEPGRDEIVNDIESRIGELFQGRIKEGITCITDEDVEAIIRSMGRPEELETESASSASSERSYTSGNQSADADTASFAGSRKRLFRNETDKVIGGVCSGLANYFNIDVVVVRIIFAICLFSFGFGVIPYIILWIAVPSTATAQIGSRRKKLYRDGEDKFLGGVCSGIAHYFGINPWIPRLLFVIPFLSIISSWGHWGFPGNFPDFLRVGFSPGALFVYIIFWLVLPEANTTAEKLEMKGEKVDMNSIKNSVVEEMRGVRTRAEKFGKEVSGIVTEKGRTMGTEAASAARRGSRSFGDIIVFLVKLVGYFIIGVICFVFVIALFAGGIAAIGLFPLKNYLLAGGTQNALAWGTLVLFIITPMIGVITWIIRRLAKMKQGSKMLRFSFIILWIGGWICVTCLVASISKDFRAASNINEQELFLANPGMQSLELTAVAPGQRYTRNRWFSMEPYSDISEDTAFVRNVDVQIIKSPTDSFRVSIMKLASGREKRFADTTAAMIPFSAVQQDSLLIIDKALPINTKNKFRNQRVILTVYVPVGKRIKVNSNFGWSHNVSFEGPWTRDFESIEFQNLENGWDNGKWYTMTADGLVNEKGEPADEYKRRSSNIEINGSGIMIDENGNKVTIKMNGISIDGDFNDDERNNDNDNGAYRYKTPSTSLPADSLRKRLKEAKQKEEDSRREQEKLDRQLRKYDSANDRGAVLYSPQFNSSDAVLYL